MLTISKGTLLAQLDALTGVGGTLNGAKVHLFSNPVNLSPNTVLADFTESAFAGYAPSAAVVWGSAFLNQQDKAETLGPAAAFGASDNVTPESARGYFVTNGAGTVWLFAEVFDTPVPMADEDANLVIIPRYVHGSQAG